jgi:hypothetical protein
MSEVDKLDFVLLDSKMIMFLRLGSLALSWSPSRVGPKSMDFIGEEWQNLVSAKSRKSFMQRFQ